MKTLTCDMVWMVAGMSVVSTALSKTGVGGTDRTDGFKYPGWTSERIVCKYCCSCVACALMTNFMSNMGTMALMSPIAASTARWQAA